MKITGTAIKLGIISVVLLFLTVMIVVVFGQMRFNTTIFSNPCAPLCLARKISAVPPSAIFRRIVYREWGLIARPTGQANRTAN